MSLKLSGHTVASAPHTVVLLDGGGANRLSDAASATDTNTTTTNMVLSNHTCVDRGASRPKRRKSYELELMFFQQRQLTAGIEQSCPGGENAGRSVHGGGGRFVHPLPNPHTALLDHLSAAAMSQHPMDRVDIREDRHPSPEELNRRRAEECASEGDGAEGGGDPTVTEACYEVRLPPVYVLERQHVQAAVLDARSVVAVTGGDKFLLWIHESTIEIDARCAADLSADGPHLSRLLVWREAEQEPIVAAPSPPTGALLAALIARINSYEPDLVDLIHRFAHHRFNFDTVHRVGNAAFSQCSRLTEVTLPNTLTHIVDGAFRDCSGLRKLTLPNTLTHIENEAFAHCTQLAEVTLPDTITHIGNKAFSGCVALSSVTLPNSLTHIADGAFSGCLALSSVTLPNSLTHIQNEVFSGCLALSSVTLPNSLTHIGNNAFARFTQLAAGERIVPDVGE